VGGATEQPAANGNEVGGPVIPIRDCSVVFLAGGRFNDGHDSQDELLAGRTSDWYVPTEEARVSLPGSSPAHVIDCIRYGFIFRPVKRNLNVP
jgi:hypothetical protein